MEEGLLECKPLSPKHFTWLLVWLKSFSFRPTVKGVCLRKWRKGGEWKGSLEEESLFGEEARRHMKWRWRTPTTTTIEGQAAHSTIKDTLSISSSYKPFPPAIPHSDTNLGNGRGFVSRKSE